MIETLMALWNRGRGGRLLVMVVTFFCLCISISLLFVTVGSIWGSLPTHGRPGGNPHPKGRDCKLRCRHRSRQLANELTVNSAARP